MSASVIRAGSTVSFRARASDRALGLGNRVAGMVEGVDRVVVEAQILQPLDGVAEGVPGAVVPGGDIGDLGLELRAEPALGLGVIGLGDPGLAPLGEVGQEANPLGERTRSRTSRPAASLACLLPPRPAGAAGVRLRQASRAASTWAGVSSGPRSAGLAQTSADVEPSAGSGATRLRIALYFSGVGVR